MSAWTIIAVLSCLCLLPLMWAIAPRSRASGMTAAGADAAHYEAQIAEIGRLEKDGAIGPVEAESARAEAARRLIASGPRGLASPSRRDAQRLAVGASLALLVGVPTIAGLAYARYGQPTLGDMPLAERRLEEPDMYKALDFIAEIETRIGVNPDDGEAQETAARIYMQIGRHGDAARAYEATIRILGESPERLSGRAEAIVSSENGAVTPEARRLFARALELDPTNGAARFYGALALKQDGRKAEAASIWRALLQETQAPELRKVIEAELAETGEPAATKTPAP
jgi:cytochrome c-type biogenesis protein CcmH